MKKDDYVSASELVRQDKLDRENDEALRIAKIYIANRRTALEHWLLFDGLSRRNKKAQIVVQDLGRQLQVIGRSLSRANPLFHKLFSFVDGLDQVWFLPDGIELLHEMHRELDPKCDSRSILPSAPTPSWRDNWSHGR